MITLYSICPFLRNESGHDYEYALSVSKAAKLNHWNHQVWISNDCQVQRPPNHWQRKNFRELKASLRNLPNDQTAIFFLESFKFYQVVALLFSLLSCRFTFQVWLLYRHAPKQMKWNGAPHRFLLALFKIIFGQKKLKLLTDSEILKLKQEQAFSSNIHLVPIPHGHSSSSSTFPKIQGVVDLWWPGSIRESKGLQEISNLSLQLSLIPTKLRLILSQSAASKGILFSKAIHWLEEPLSRMDYESWLHTVEIVLLPYDPGIYQASTSGIFVETICAGAIPVVKDHTWMSSELQKYGLADLILDWASPMLLSKLEMIPRNPKIKQKLQTMSAEYKKFHSVENFAKNLSEIFNYS